MNIIKQKIDVDKNINQLLLRKGRLKYDVEFIKTVLESVN